ncbi:hypothetical protein [Nitrosomonas sp. Nm34]|uniref:hypothetical protein n=1 Tax=Nitrosomonas sp. Nm34 TaxID=1881055 RepID=UPI001587E8A0|nr:hypothetical protein [Nitrosomonas sp. Nm34]
MTFKRIVFLRLARDYGTATLTTLPNVVPLQQTRCVEVIPFTLIQHDQTLFL